MTGKDKIPATPAIRVLRDKRVPFSPHPYDYEEHGGTAVAARALRIDEHAVVKTIVMEDEKKNPFIVLMHGDRQVSTRNVARLLGLRSVRTCDPKDASRHTGYLVGGTSPFGTKKNLPVYIEETILGLPSIYINGGKKGLLVEIKPQALTDILKPTVVNVAVAGA
ncbi:MAG: Cys-tRNA(Pro) deacylase [Deltaproteobacteria bacterium]|nr:Cys-tRNA(Pro) deacylase [Deltaproteobacteria bacterium]